MTSLTHTNKNEIKSQRVSIWQNSLLTQTSSLPMRYPMGNPFFSNGLSYEPSNAHRGVCRTLFNEKLIVHLIFSIAGPNEHAVFHNGQTIEQAFSFNGARNEYACFRIGLSFEAAVLCNALCCELLGFPNRPRVAEVRSYWRARREIKA